MDDLIIEFVAETLENLSILDQELVKFEQSPNDVAILSNVFRMLHTIKGTCGFLGLPRLEKVAHAGEDILGKFRDGELTPDPQSVTAVLKCMDRIRRIVESLSQTGNEGNEDDTALISELKAVLGGQGVISKRVDMDVSAPAQEHPPSDFPVAAELLEEFDGIVSTQTSVVGEVIAPIKAVEAEPVPSIVPPNSIQRANTGLQEKVSTESNKDKAALQTIRVNVDVLENLMTLVSEMVLTRNQLLQLARTPENSIFKAPIERLSRTTSELQEGVMKTRMQPIGNAWGKLPRIVRDLANELGKKISLNLRGEETELDRQVLELIQDPLTHMVRNSADHGLETPEERRLANKPESGTIYLSAAHEGGHIIIEISDDGRGINTERVRAKVLERGLATADELAAMDDKQVNKFIMRAGFSTAEKLTKVSGRGVGMDVVRSNIEKIGGTVEFESIYGQGSTFTIKIPLTLAIISSLIVVSGGERYALPQIAVKEVVRVSRRSEHLIESLNRVPVLRLRDQLLPLVNLRSLLNVGSEEYAWKPSGNTFDGYIVVCRNGSHDLGVIVDQIADVEEIVVKPLSNILGAAKYFSGNTILGDGQVILILDINGLASTMGHEAFHSRSSEQERIESDTDQQNVLLFKTAREGLKAIPLSKVTRIENVDCASVETLQGNSVVQYRDQIMPLITMDDCAVAARKGRQLVLVFGEARGSVGLVIAEIVDITSDSLRILKPSSQPGVLGSSLVAGYAVDLVDADYFITKGSPHDAVRKIGAVA